MKNSLVMEVIDARKMKTEEGRDWGLSSGSSCCQLRAKAKDLGWEDIEVGLEVATLVTQVEYVACPGEEGGLLPYFAPVEYSFALYKQMP